jgi:ribonucleoside-diphosphate reductase beta chain
VLVPPGYHLGEEYEYLGFTSQEMNEFAFTALSRRLKVIGVSLPRRHGLTVRRPGGRRV